MLKNSLNNIKTELSKQQLKDYADDGFLLIKDVFDGEEINILLEEVNRSIYEQESGHKNVEGGLVREEDQSTVRTLNGLHFEYEIFQKLCCHPRLLFPTQQMTRDKDLYIYQFKVNLKKAFVGDVWEWHQDYIYWLRGDGMPAPKAISVAIFLDDVTEYNAPLMFIPGSHKLGMIDVVSRSDVSPNQPSWMNFVSSKLQYPAPRELVTKLAQERGLVAPKASKGSILFFHGNILHGSTSNLSPFDRRYIFITYNPVTNIDLNFAKPRPRFLSGRDITPLVVTEDNIIKTFSKGYIPITVPEIGPVK